MTSQTSGMSNAKKRLAALLSGVSAAALFLTAVPTARAGITITPAGSATSITVTSASTTDFILIQGTVTGNVTNDGTIGLPAPVADPFVIDGGDVGGFVDNNGLITGTSTGIAIRNATTGAIGNNPTATITGLFNGGTVNVAATSPTAAIYGVRQTGASIQTFVFNNGLIMVSSAGSGTLHGSANGLSIVSSGTLDAEFNNQLGGTLSVLASYTGDASQQATARGVHISNTIPASTAVIDVENGGTALSGTLNVTARASSVDPLGNNADANAFGITLVAQGTASATGVNVNFTNHTLGDINIQASALADAVAGNSASAFVAGIRQSALGGQDPSVTFTNHGSVSIGALANAGAVTAAVEAQSAVANATLDYALEQRAQAGTGTAAGTSASATFRNTSLLSFDVNVTASASASKLASATALVTGDAVFQSATGAADVDVLIDNSGAININLQANATTDTNTLTAATEGAFARASAGDDVFDQNATATTGVGSVANATFNNTGTVLVDIGANALGSGTTGINDAFATAKVFSDIVEQRALANQSATASFTNAGTFSALLDATASVQPNGLGADASAQINGTVFDQNATATGTGAGNTANALLTNSGTVLIDLGADADGVTTAEADARIFNVVDQAARGENASASIDNQTGGSFTVRLDADANATGSTGIADATAFIKTGIDQFASGTTTAGTPLNALTASASLNNSGTIVFDLDASALGNAGADADAVIGNDVVQQDAIAVGSATASVVNANNFSVMLDATATATGGGADARASIGGSIISQNVSASTTTTAQAGVASATISNTGNVLVGINANALGTGTGVTGGATASAKLGGIFTQNVLGNNSANAAFTNASGATFSAQLAAQAGSVSATGSAFALAQLNSSTVGAAIQQGAKTATTTKPLSGPSTVTFTNSGMFDIGLLANATATAGAMATAVAHGDILGQAATGTDASVAISNLSPGSYTVSLTANANAASGTADALASISDYVFSQAALGLTAITTVTITTVTPSAFTTVVGGTASASLTNSGSVLVDLNAAALGTGVSGASATAAIGGGLVQQQATGELGATVTFDNQTGATFSALLNATAGSASATGGAAASARFGTTVTGGAAVIGQSAFAGTTVTGTITTLTGTGPASASLANSGDINIGLGALATVGATTAPGGADADAVIFGDVVRQRAHGGGTTATTAAGVSFSNSGAGTFSFTLDATANAASGPANALASVTGSVFDQSALAGTVTLTTPTGISSVTGITGAASASYSNTGSILIDLGALAGGGVVSATATARVDDNLVNQFAQGTSANVSFTNGTGGSFSALIHATANGATGSARANATIGNIAFDQSATAAATKFGALVGPAGASFTNNGSILLSLDASANASGISKLADADAIIGKNVIDQVARGTAASVFFSNTSTLSFSVVLDASAVAASGAADALASIGADVFDQTAFASPTSGGAGGTASATYANSGSVLVDLRAFASGTTDVDATAVLNSSVVDQSADGQSATVSLTNSGNFTVELDATANHTLGGATGSFESASANASINGIAFRQDASATKLDGGAASASFANSGSVLLDLHAAASGSSAANAEAGFNKDVVGQFASGTDASVSFANTGTGTGDMFSVVLNATATATAGSADAAAEINGFVFDQSAFAFTRTTMTGTAPTITNVFGGTALASLTNSGTVLVDLNAAALGTGLSGASATAAIDGGVVRQQATGELGATAAFSNAAGATFSALLNATAGSASATGGAAASARFGTTVTGGAAVIGQSAFAVTTITTGTTTTLTGTGPASASLTNSGDINIGLGALASATSSADADAVVNGDVVRQFALGSSANVSYVDSGSSFTLTLGATANAASGPANALASVTGSVFDQSAIAGTVTLTTPTDTPSVTAVTGPATASYSNSGSVLVDFGAFASGDTFADAAATVGGDLVNQFAKGTSANASFVNSNTATGTAPPTGFFTVALAAAAVATSGSAKADVRINKTAFDQSARATSGGVGVGAASASFTNSGSILLGLGNVTTGQTFGAFALGSTFADASAVIGENIVEQIARGTVADAAFANSGSFRAILDATATATKGEADALARIGADAINQSAFADGSAAATAGINNSGTLLFDLGASASGTTDVDATASLTAGAANQFAGGQSATVNLTNSGDFSVLLAATANHFNTASPVLGTLESARAVARIGGTAIQQDALATLDGGGAAAASIANTGSILFDLDALASANTGTAFAQAKIGPDVFNQLARGTQATVSLTNNDASSISVLLNAVATATKGSATASARVGGDAFRQNANASFASGGVASATLNNTGTISISLLADADAAGSGFDADADAFLDGVIDQFARGTAASVSFSNADASTLSVVLGAAASAVSGTANALANISHTVISQRASATKDTGGLASVGFSNTGSILFDLDATATGTGATSAANARVVYGGDVAHFMNQQAFGTSADIDFTNTGTFRVFGDADANGGGSATATAEVQGNVFVQNARGTSDAGGAANASFANTGTLLLDLNADADGTTSADAVANIDGSVLNQRATGITASAIFSNADASSLMVLLTASASAPSGAASATASISKSAFQQDATATFSGGGAASASYTNSGTILVDLNALATGSTAVARARIGSTLNTGMAGIDQAASGTSATVSLANSGSIIFDFDANAGGLAPATATASLFGTGIGQSAVGVTFASVAHSNTAAATTAFNLAATASDPAAASAIARITGDVVNQSASASATATHTANANFTNNGTFAANITANATADTGSANASATLGGYFINQSVNANGTGEGNANASITNNGNLTLNLDAFAGGTAANAANANASIGTGLFGQFASGKDPDVDLTLGGFTLDIDATASAPSGAAIAAASVGSILIDQHATGPTTTGGFAGVDYNNNGTFAVSLSANATGSTAANAFAGGISFAAVHQSAMGGDADADFNNNGIFSVAITANAIANGTGLTDNATALASLGGTGIKQTAIGGTGGLEQFAGVALDNNSTISFAINAFASGDTARATARFGDTLLGAEAGIRQNVFGNESGDARIDNSGLISFSVNADANGGQPATALASFAGSGIDQFASGSEDADAVMFNTKNATTAFQVVASASDPDSARATARMTGNAVNQTAQATGASFGQANATLTNNGTLFTQIIGNATAIAEVGSGPATAVAALSGTGIHQAATGGIGVEAFAGAAISNKGTIAFTVSANANGSAANASARLGTATTGGQAAIRQSASSGENARATLSNSGLISVNILADAPGALPATAAAALFGTGIVQNATGVSFVTASMSNTVSATTVFNVIANATDPGGASANASITGGVVHQSARATGGATGRATASLTNNGLLSANVTANASAASGGPAVAVGSIGGTAIQQDAVANGTTGTPTASALLVNNNTVNLDVHGNATGSNARASALFGADVLNQLASANSALASFDNNSAFGVTVIADASAIGGTNATANASIAGTGIEQSAVGTGVNSNAKASLTNNGSLTFVVIGDADGPSPAALANIGGDVVNQLASAKTATASFSNTVTFAYGASALADATGGGAAAATASIAGSGIEQDASGTGIGSSGTATLSNTGSLTIMQRADAFSTSGAVAALARVGGDVVNQFATGGVAAAATLSNTATFAYGGSAKADAGTGAAAATASIAGTGIEQSAVGGVISTARIVNSGSLTLGQRADASAGGAATARALIGGDFVNQFASGGFAGAVLTNSATLAYSASADADGSVAAATASIAGTGIEQDGSGGPTGITNNASLTLLQRADALATSGAAGAIARVGGDVINQRGTGIIGAAAFTNTATFSYNGIATANATGSTGAAAATAAIVGSGIQQSAPGGAQGVAVLNNTGSILFNLDADADANAAAAANAVVGGHLVNQFASGGSSATASFVNSNTATGTAPPTGFFTARFDASANGSAAVAVAGVTGSGADVFHQSVNATGGAGSNGSATFTNNGTVLVDINAFASGTTPATASALVADDVVDTFASGEDATASFVNTTGSTFTVNLDATANETGGPATARALIGGSGVNLDAIATGGTSGVANATFANSGTVSFDLSANASGGVNTTQRAFASAGFGSDVVNVDARNFDGGTANSNYTNSGMLMVDIDALARATTAAVSGWATAVATVHDIVEQTASAGFGSSAAAVASYLNTGLLSVGLNATASATFWAFATARIDSDIIDQKATGVAAATASFSNTSAATTAVAVTARAISTTGGTSALGSGRASAFATLESAVLEQSAFAATTTGSVANALATNNGSLVVGVNATAIGTKALASVKQGSHGDVVYQQARGGTATTSFTNNGTFSLVLDAFASGLSGDADARATFSESGFDLQATGSGGAGSSGSASFSNTGTLTLAAMAHAVATNKATATAFFSNDVFEMDASGETASASFNNSGNLSILLSAIATSTDTDAFAFATFSETGIEMDAVANQGADISASASLVNSGTLSIIAAASASGGDTVTAVALMTKEFVDQTARASGTATASFVNSGSLTLGGVANAVGPNARATARQTGDDAIEQNAINFGGTGAQANVIFNNSGSFTYGLTANATGSKADALASLTGNVVEQLGFTGESVDLDFTNSGSFNVGINAFASAATDSADAVALLTGAVVSQVGSAFGGTAENASVNITNSGNLAASVNATALAPSDMATATAILGAGFAQFVTGDGINQAAITNSGVASFSANALASGSTAFALAIDPGAIQGLFTKEGTDPTQTIQSISAQAAGDNVLAFTNSGSFSVEANATANAGGGAFASATATATGLLQGMFGGTSATGTMTFNNSGSFTVNAQADANGATFASNAEAFALGYSARAQAPDQIMTLNVANSGSFTVNANAVVGGGATTLAAATAKATGMVFRAASIAGSAANSGTFSVNATASGGTANEADAFGVMILADVFTGSFTNTGSLVVQAQGSTTATGIFIGTSAVHTNTIAPVGGEVGTIVNDGGSLFVATQNGALTRGNAINVEAAPNPILISLQGNTQQGNIFGNIELGTDDSIEVTNGPTRFDGIVNPDLVLEGSLAVKSGGTLIMASNTTQGDFAVANVDTYTQTSDGTIVYELPQVSQTPGQINADVANLDGTVSAILDPNVLPPDTLLYEEVVVANTLNGVWSKTDDNLNSPFLELEAIYPGDNTADLGVTRTPFPDIPGLTINQKSAATGIENVYSPALTGPFADMLLDIMFELPIEDYPNALDQLAGAEYAQNLQMNLWSMSLLNDAVQDRVNAGAVASSNRYGNTLIRRGDTAVWGSVAQTWGDNDGDVEAPGYDRDQTAFYAGIDHALADHFLLGFVAGYYENEVSFDSGNRKEEDGVQLGLYASYDNQRFYIRGLFGYASYNADSRRMINIVDTVGTALASYDTRVISFGGEVGRRFEVGTNAYFTPFGALRYAHAKNDPFTETGVPAANLTVFESTGESLLSELGVRFSAALNPGANTLIVPEISASWQRELLDEIVTTNHAFAAVPGSNFPIISSHTDPDALLVRAGLAIAHNDTFEIKAGYTGRFHGDFTEHMATLRLTVKFGGGKPRAKAEPQPVEREPEPVVQPAPPPEPVYEEPAATIPGPFLVFFDWDSSVLDEEDLAVIDEAVEAYNEFGIARIFAEGHADRSGPDDYNQDLSVDRASAVMQALIQRGVPADAINIEGKGEREPRVETADGVREAQNRRVEITLIE